MLNKYPLIAISVHCLLIFSCLIEISYELGFHAFDYFKSHHGLILFSIAALLHHFDAFNKHRSK